VKCLVWDLDGTVWDGVLAEGGVEPFPGVAEVMDGLDRRGVLQSVASRSDAGLATAALEGMGLLRYLVCPQIGWGRKGAMVGAVASGLGIRMESVALIDDDPFELSEAAFSCPGVRTYEASERDELLSYAEFGAGGNVGDASWRRRSVEAKLRMEGAMAAYGGSRRGFLKGCGMVLTVRSSVSGGHGGGMGRPMDMGRALELLSRSGKMGYYPDRARAEAESYFGGLGAVSTPDPPDGGVRRMAVTACLKDRFGDHGLVGAALITARESRAEVEAFAMSCRVEGRGLGPAFYGCVAHVVGSAFAGAGRLTQAYAANGYNAPLLAAMRSAGFVPARGAAGGPRPGGAGLGDRDSAGGVVTLELRLTGMDPPDQDWLTIRFE